MDSPPAEIVSSRCPDELTSSMDTASPARSVPAVPAPIPEDSKSRGVVPASAAAMAALRAAGPEPTMTRFQDSMVLVLGESCLRHEDDARGFAPKIALNLQGRGRFFVPRMLHLPFYGPYFLPELRMKVWWLLQLIQSSLLPHFSM